MALSWLFKQPTRRHKYGVKKRIIWSMDKYDKQYNYGRRLESKFQTARFRKHGSVRTWMNTTVALFKTMRDFNIMDGEKLHPKHGSLLLFIKDYVVENDIESFSGKQLFEYYPHLSMFFETYANSHKSFLMLLNDLTAMEFLKSHGSISDPSFTPTMRMRSFFRVYEKYNNELFNDETDQKQST
jgi:hypothetical protein